jgi:hypothetical protein
MAYLPNKTWRFPLEKQEDYKGTITFRPVKYTPPEISSSFGNVFTRKGSGILSQLLNGEGSIASGLVEGFTNPSGSRNQDRDRQGQPSLSDPNIVSEEPVSAASNVVDRSKGVILYLPANINLQDQINYEQPTLGPTGAIGLAGAQQGTGMINALSRGVGQATGSMIDLVKGNVADQKGARLAAVRLAQAGGETVSTVARAGLATTINPNTINLFRSVTLREFSFNFKLIAASAKEAEEIDGIIKFFRATMYPDTINFDPNGLNVPIGYEFPDKFQIEMRYADKQVGFKLLNSVLRSVQVLINPQSMSFHKDGKPSEVDLTLAFGEERTLNRNDILQGY